MMAGGAVRVEGLDDVRRKIRKMEQGLDQDAAKGDLKRMNLEAAEIVAGVATGLVPVRTGKLRDTIRAAGAQKSGRVRSGYNIPQGAAASGNWGRMPYAGPIHFGWPARNISPQPFLYDALDRRRSEVFDAYNRNMSQIVKKYRLD